MVRIVLCGLFLGLMALPVGAQQQYRPLSDYLNELRRPATPQRDYYRDYMRNLERERKEYLYQQDRNRRNQNSWGVDETNCLYGRGHFNKCR